MKRSFSVRCRTVTVSTVGSQSLHLNITSKRNISDSLYIIKTLTLVTGSAIHTHSALHPFSTVMLSVVDREVFYPLLLFWWRPWQEPLALPNVLKNIAQDTELQNPYYQPRCVSSTIYRMVIQGKCIFHCCAIFTYKSKLCTYAYLLLLALSICDPGAQNQS